MNNQNKVNLILFIAQSFSDEQCANILASFTEKIANKGGVALANSAEWDESEHLRAEDGKWTDGNGVAPKGKKNDIPSKRIQERINQNMEENGEAPRTAEVLERFCGFTDEDMHEAIDTNQVAQLPSRYRSKFECWKDAKEIQELTDAARGLKKRQGKGYSVLEYKMLELLEIEEKGYLHEEDKPGWHFKPMMDGTFYPNEALEKQLSILDDIREVKKIEKETKTRDEDLKKNQRRAKRYHEVEDEMDEIEEAYGDRDRGVGFKWPETQEADDARKRYSKLKRERSRLDKQINWDLVEEK